MHIVIVKDDHFVEIQFRTPWQDAWAQSVEQDTRRLGAGLKFGAGPDDLLEYYSLVSEYLRLRERNVVVPEDLAQALAKSYAGTRRYFSRREGKGGSSA